MLVGLKDYTTDERGDVGSWIRIACIGGLAAVSETLLVHRSMHSMLDDVLPPNVYHTAIGGILKQGLERLDNVRQTAGEQLLRLLKLPLPEAATGPERWGFEGRSIIEGLYTE
jgi:tubulin-specific chaperone D